MKSTGFRNMKSIGLWRPERSEGAIKGPEGYILTITHYYFNTLGSDYLPRPSASGNIAALDAIFIDIPRGRVEYL